MANADGRTLGEVIQQARVAGDLSLRDLAKKLDVSPSYLSDIENDRRTPSEEVLTELVKHLSLDLDDVMAKAGRFGDRADRYMKREPMAGVLFRRLSEMNAPPKVIERLIREVDQAKKKGEGDDK